MFDEREDDHGDPDFRFAGNIEELKDPHNPFIHIYLIKNKRNQVILIFREAEDLLSLWDSIQNEEPLNKTTTHMFKYSDTVGNTHYLYSKEMRVPIKDSDFKPKEGAF